MTGNHWRSNHHPNWAIIGRYSAQFMIKSYFLWYDAPILLNICIVGLPVCQLHIGDEGMCHRSYGKTGFCNCKTLPVHLPEADCSIFTLSVGRRLSSRFVTINSTSIKPSMKVRNLTYVHHIILSASYLTQCIMSAPSVHHQSIMSASLVHHHCIIRASSGHHKHIISK